MISCSGQVLGGSESVVVYSVLRRLVYLGEWMLACTVEYCGVVDSCG
jgi:hypothetical protein